MNCVACPAPAVQRHHVVYEQELRRLWRHAERRGLPIHSLAALTSDARNIVPVCMRCHARHHSAFKPLPLRALPDSVFEFAADVLGAEPAYEYLRRRYENPDSRLGALLFRDAA